MYKGASNSEQYQDMSGSQSVRIKRGGNEWSAQDATPRIDDDWNIQQLESRREELRHEIDGHLANISAMKGKIAAAKAEKLVTNKYADPKWFAAINSALRHEGQRHQSAITALAEVNRRVRKMKADLNDWDDGRMFITAAKRFLDPGEYDSIWAEVRRMRKE